MRPHRRRVGDAWAERNGRQLGEVRCGPPRPRLIAGPRWTAWALLAAGSAGWKTLRAGC